MKRWCDQEVCNTHKRVPLPVDVTRYAGASTVPLTTKIVLAVATGCCEVGVVVAWSEEFRGRLFDSVM